MIRKNLPCLLLVTLALAACSDNAPPPEPLRAVRTIVIGTGSTATEHDFSGDVHARHESPLGFRIGGKLIARMVDPGTKVTAGQPLAKLDPADVTLQAAQAAAQLAQAEADVKRFRELRARNFISQSALDAHETAYKATQAQAGIARHQEEYATLRADAPGIVASVLVEAGQVVAAGTPVVILAQDGEREVAISLPESDLKRFKVGQPATIRLWADASDSSAKPAKVYRGRIRELAPMADPVTRTYAARVSILDSDSEVVLGMTAKVSLPSEAADSIAIPATAVLQQGETPAVWVVAADGSVALRDIKVLSWRDDLALIGSGLKAGERIVERGVHKLHAGEKIVITEAAK